MLDEDDEEGNGSITPQIDEKSSSISPSKMIGEDYEFGNN